MAEYNNDGADQLVNASKKPDVVYLNNELQRSLFDYNNFAQVSNADDIRLCRWTGQTDDGKKHSEAMPDGEQVFPFEGASDVRTRLVDSTCNELSCLMTTAFQRSKVNVGGTEVTDSSEATMATTLMRWLSETKMSQELLREAQLGSQFGQQYGWTIFHVGWDQKAAVRKQKITFEEVAAIAMQQPDSIVAGLPEMIMNPEAEDEAANLISASVPDIKVSDARKLVRDLRETGIGEIDEEYLQKNAPAVTALKPYQDVAIPPETIDLQDARVIYRRIWMTEVQVRAKEIDEGWDKEFVEMASTMQGKQTWFGITNDNFTIEDSSNVMRQSHLIEIVYAYARQLDDKGVPGIYCTVFCPAASSELYGKHELLGYAHGEYPFVEYRRERIRRAITESRGVPQIAATDQDEIKTQHDSIRDSTAFTTLPPIKVVKRIGGINKVGPGVQLPVTRADDYTWMEPPARPPNTAFDLIRRVEATHAAYFGTAHVDVPAIKTQMMQQNLVNVWLESWAKIYTQMFKLCLQYMPAEEIERVTGGQLPQNISEIQHMFDFIVRYNVEELDTDLVKAKLEAITKFVVPLDTGGVIDRNKLVKIIIEAISPEAARELVIDQATASQSLFKGVQSDIGMMMLGNEPLYVENDPAAQTKLQYTQDVMGKNPKAQQALQGDELFRRLMENYVKNLQFSVTQKENSQIGRVGVTPVSDEMAAEAQLPPPAEENVEMAQAETAQGAY